MSDNLSNLFNTWQFNPIDADAVYERTIDAIMAFETGALNSPLLDDLGTDFDYKDMFDIKTKMFDGGDVSADQYANTKFTIQRKKLLKQLFHQKMKEQHVLQRAKDQILFLMASVRGGLISSNGLLNLVEGKISINDSNLDMVYKRNQAAVGTPFFSKSVDLAMAGYKKSQPKNKIDITPNRRENIIPFISKTCRDLNQIAYDTRHLRCYDLHRKLSYYRAYVIRDNRQESERRDLAHKFKDTIQDTQAEFNHSADINERLVIMTQNAFPNFSDRILVPDSRHLKL